MVLNARDAGRLSQTLEAFQHCINAKAQILCISSGGKLEEIASKEGYDFIKVPGGNAPRTCVGYSIVSQLVSLSKLGLTKKDYRKLLKESIPKRVANINLSADKIESILEKKFTMMSDTMMKK